MLFPPQGLSAADSFFAEERAGIFGRTYVGVLATALPSHVTAQVRTLATLLQAPALTVGDDEAIDGYWTLVVYFNSLRELGRASTLVQADIREYLNSVWDRIGLTEGLLPGRAKQSRRFINNFRELTSSPEEQRYSGDPSAIVRRAPIKRDHRPLLRDEHDPSRPRRAAPQPDVHRRPAKNCIRVHSGIQSRRPRPQQAGPCSDELQSI